MTFRFAVSTFLAFLPLASILACSDEESGDDLVTLSGVVRIIDNGQIAVGARVSLWGTDIRDDVPTGTDGVFLLRVPKGSRLLLHTDDFDATTADIWFPLINVEHPAVIINEDMTDLAIHTCPRTAVPELGSVAAWDNYLQNGDAANGDLFEPTSSANATGLLSLVVQGARGGARAFCDGFSITADSPNLPLGYLRLEKFFNLQLGTPDWSLGPDIAYPPGTAVTDPLGFCVGFGGSDFTDNEVEVTITDTVSSRGLVFQNVLVPMAPGTISLILPCWIDGQANIPFKDWGRYMGFF